jgi:hypothetical protein
MTSKPPYRTINDVLRPQRPLHNHRRKRRLQSHNPFRRHREIKPLANF